MLIPGESIRVCSYREILTVVQGIRGLQVLIFWSPVTPAGTQLHSELI